MVSRLFLGKQNKTTKMSISGAIPFVYKLHNIFCQQEIFIPSPRSSICLVQQKRRKENCPYRLLWASRALSTFAIIGLFFIDLMIFKKSFAILFKPLFLCHCLRCCGKAMSPWKQCQYHFPGSSNKENLNLALTAFVMETFWLSFPSNCEFWTWSLLMKN